MVLQTGSDEVCLSKLSLSSQTQRIIHGHQWCYNRNDRLAASTSSKAGTNIKIEEAFHQHHTKMNHTNLARSGNRKPKDYCLLRPIRNTSGVRHTPRDQAKSGPLLVRISFPSWSLRENTSDLNTQQRTLPPHQLHLSHNLIPADRVHEKVVCGCRGVKATLHTP